MKVITRIIKSTLLGTVTYFAFAPLAYAERGYHAYGGEIMLAVMVGLGYLYYKAEVAR